MPKSLSGHQRSTTTATDEWLTPPEIIKALGDFDLDPCAPEVRPWNTARRHYTKTTDGLAQPWGGRVWCNPPFGRAAAAWASRMAAHGRGTLLLPARTETALWFDHVWPMASAALFLKGRPHFHYADGRRAPFNSGAPIALIAYGAEDANKLRLATAIHGKYIPLNFLLTAQNSRPVHVGSAINHAYPLNAHRS